MTHYVFFPAVFFASGVAALIYQVIWQRMLMFTTGADVHSVSIIVAAFMAGMGVGSLAGGWIADRVTGRGRLMAFAACEFGIALFALASTALYYQGLYAHLGTHDLSGLAVGLLSFSATLFPTFCMGMSLPLAARAVTIDARQPARWVPLLYGWNTLGASAGALVVIAVLFRRFDFETILHLAAALSVACGLSALWLARRRPLAVSPASSTGTSDASAAVSTSPLKPQWADLRGPIALYALAGFVSLSLEIVWFRILGVMLKSTAVTFGQLLTVFLACLGVGSLVANHRRVRAWPARRVFLLSQAAIPLYAVTSLAIFIASLDRAALIEPLWEYLGSYRQLPGGAFGSWLALSLNAGVPLLLMGPSTFLMGFGFGFLQRAVQTDLAGLGRRVGWLQAANIAGAVVGTLATGFVLLDAFGTSGTLRVVAVAGGVFLWLAAPARLAPRAVAVGTALFAVALVPAPSVLWPRLHGTAAEATVFAEDGTGIALLKREPGSTVTVVYVNGLSHSQLPFGGAHTVLGALPALIHPAPARIAVIGLGSGDTTWAIGGREETQQIDSIEIIGPVLDSLREIAGRLPYPGLPHLLTDRRVRHHLSDGRAFLLKSATRYDIIEADALWPGSAYAGNLYSVEYFTLLRSRLAPGGLAVTWAATPRVIDSLVAVFPHVLVAGDVAIGSESPIAFDPAVVRRRLDQPFTAAHYSAGHVNLVEELRMYFDRPPRIFDSQFDRRGLRDVNRDLFPRDEFRVKSID